MIESHVRDLVRYDGQRRTLQERLSKGDQLTDHDLEVLERELNEVTGRIERSAEDLQREFKTTVKSGRRLPEIRGAETISDPDLKAFLEGLREVSKRANEAKEGEKGVPAHLTTDLQNRLDRATRLKGDADQNLKLLEEDEKRLEEHEEKVRGERKKVEEATADLRDEIGRLEKDEARVKADLAKLTKFEADRQKDVAKLEKDKKSCEARVQKAKRADDRANLERAKRAIEQNLSQVRQLVQREVPGKKQQLSRMQKDIERERGEIDKLIAEYDKECQRLDDELKACEGRRGELADRRKKEEQRRHDLEAAGESGRRVIA